jgi:hypothetical protein
LTQVKAVWATFAILIQSKKKAGPVMDAVARTSRLAEETVVGHGWEAYCAAARVDSATLSPIVSLGAARTTSRQQKAQDADRDS